MEREYIHKVFPYIYVAKKVTDVWQTFLNGQDFFPFQNLVSSPPT